MMRIKLGEDEYEIDERELVQHYKDVVFPVNAERVKQAIRANYIPKGVRKLDPATKENSPATGTEDVLPTE